MTNEQIEQILDGAPEGAVEIHEWEYYDEDGIICGEVEESAQGQTPYSDAWHHLSDLREILTLRKRVAELESIRTGIGEYLFEMAACFTVEVHNDLTRIMESKEQSE